MWFIEVAMQCMYFTKLVETESISNTLIVVYVKIDCIRLTYTRLILEINRQHTVALHQCFKLNICSTATTMNR